VVKTSEMGIIDFWTKIEVVAFSRLLFCHLFCHCVLCAAVLP